MRSTRTFLIAALLISATLVVFLAMSRNSRPTLAVDYAADDVPDMTSAQPASPIPPSTLNSRARDCIPFASIGQHPDAYLADKWYASWGAPASFNRQLSSRPYAHIPQTDLEDLAEAGTAEAIHELGRDLAWRAFRGGQRMPDLETLFEIGGSRYPYKRPVDEASLARGRNHLYQAAIHGRLFALAEISLSYAHHAAVLRELGMADDSEIVELRIKAYAYGEAIEEQISGLHDGYFQVSVPETHRERADNELTELINRFTLDRAAIGHDSSTLPKLDDEILQALNICLR